MKSINSYKVFDLHNEFNGETKKKNTNIHRNNNGVELQNIKNNHASDNNRLNGKYITCSVVYENRQKVYVNMNIVRKKQNNELQRVQKRAHNSLALWQNKGEEEKEYTQ